MSTSDHKRKLKRSSRCERRREMREEARAQARLAATASGARRILRIAEVEIMTGKARTQIYDEMEKGIFPQPVPLDERAVGWMPGTRGVRRTVVVSWTSAGKPQWGPAQKA